MRVLTVTTFFPNAADPHRAVFVRNLVAALSRKATVCVVSPVFYVLPLPMLQDWRKQRTIPNTTFCGTTQVLHPRYVALPKMMWSRALFYFVGAYRAVSTIVKPDRNWVLHGHFAYPDGVAVALLAKTLRLPYVITVHGSDINVYLDKPILRVQIQWALKNASAVIAVSRALFERVIAEGRARHERVAYIPCAGFDPSVFHPLGPTELAERTDIAGEARVVLFVGQLVAVKCVGVLLEAWIELQKAGRLKRHDALVIVGDGPLRQLLIEKAERGGVTSTVHFIGSLTQHEIARHMSAANLLCLPSASEGTPNVIVEALACGIPVVASNVGGIPELLTNDLNGFMVEPNQPTELSDAIYLALEKKWDSQAIVGSVAGMTWDEIAAKNVRVLREISAGETNA